MSQPLPHGAVSEEVDARTFTNIFMYVFMHVCIYVCIYIYIYIYVFKYVCICIYVVYVNRCGTKIEIEIHGNVHIYNHQARGLGMHWVAK